MHYTWLTVLQAIDMHGYNQYVWPAYGLAVLVLGCIAARPALLKRRLRKLNERDASHS